MKPELRGDLKKQRLERVERRRHEVTLPADYSPSAAVCAAALVLLTLLMAVARAHTYDEPLEMDASTYAVMAREMRSGKYLYSEIWDNKPPAIFASYYLAQSVVGDGPVHVYLLGLFMASITLAGVYFAATEAAGRVAGLCAATFWAIVATDLNLQANQPNTEVFINACLIWGFGLLIRMPSDRLALRRAVSIGMLVALASLYKQVAVCAAALMAAHVVATGFTRRSVIQAAVMAIVVAFVWAGVIGYFAATDRLADFPAVVFEFSRTYAGNIWENLATGLQSQVLMPPLVRPFWALLVTGAFGLAFPSGAFSARTRLLLLAFCLTTFASVALPGRFFSHYYQLWLPLLCVSAAYGIAALRMLTNRRWTVPVVGAALATLLAFVQMQAFALPPDEWSARKFGDRLLLSRRAAQIISQLVPPEERFLQWGHHVELYYYADRRPVGGEFRSRYLVGGPRSAQRTAQLLAELQANPPELIVLVAGHDFPKDHPVPQWILAYYKTLAAQPCDPHVAGRHLFLARRGGRLEELQHGICLEADDKR